MSADEFDPAVERLFARSPALPDAELFAAEVQGRLASSSRLRTVALTAAGLVGGVIAVRETVDFNFAISGDRPAGDLNQTAENAILAVQAAAQPGLEQLGLGQIDLLAMGGMQLFWITAAGVLALLATGLTRLSQEA